MHGSYGAFVDRKLTQTAMLVHRPNMTSQHELWDDVTKLTNCSHSLTNTQGANYLCVRQEHILGSRGFKYIADSDNAWLPSLLNM